MLKKILFYGLSVVFAFSVAAGTSAGNLSSFTENLNKTAGAGGAGYDTTKQSPLLMVNTIIQVALSFLGVIFLVLTIYGGFLWMTAAGDESKVESARKMITAAIIGLIIIVSAYAISYFVISKLVEKTLAV